MPDKKYHGAIVEVLDHVKSLIKDGAKVLEIGPGHVPFSKATHFCGWTLEEKSKLQNYKVANVSVDVLPYSNKEFDFVYCRHVIEDLWNPSHCLNEISRAKPLGPLAPKLYEGRQIQDLLTLGHVPVAAVAEGWTKVQEHLVNVT
jgi:hypothetical protein